MNTRLALLLCTLFAASAAGAETVGDVDTAFKLIGPDHKIVVDAYDDPRVNGVTCYVSRAKTGGVSGALGLAEDKAEASIACRQVGPIGFTGPLPKREEVYAERQSILFKRLRVVRKAELGVELATDPVGSVLNCVYLAEAEGRIVGLSDISTECDIPQSLTARWVDVLSKRGILETCSTPERNVQFTHAGIVKVERILASAFDVPVSD